jgi:peptide/nickel transport system substrate-binding protein
MGATMLTILLGLPLVLAVACGGAPAAPEPTAATVVEPTPVSGPGETSLPTAIPQATAQSAEVEVNPGKLTIMVGDWAGERFDPVFAAGRAGALNYGRVMHGFLISGDAEREMIPGIANEWSLSDDGLTWEFTIREGVKFHNGNEVTAEDVQWSLEHMFGPGGIQHFGVSATSISHEMDRAEVTRPDKVSVFTKTPLTTFDIEVSEAGDKWYGVMPKRPKLYDVEQELAYDQDPIGAGPMRLVSHVQASSMSFERFEEYYYQPDNGFSEDKQVKFQSLDLLLVPEEATRVAALRSGEADIVPASLTTREQVETGGGRMVFGQEGVYVDAKLLGCWDPQYPCHDKRVRQALDYAIDKKLIQERLYGGPEVFQVKGWSVVTPSTIGYTPELDPWPFDPDKARQLLSDAGYPDGQGFGKLIVHTFPSTSMPFQVEAAQLAAEFWRRELNLDVEVRVGDSLAIAKTWRAQEINGQVLWRDNETRKDATNITRSSYGDLESLTRVSEDPEILRSVQDTVRIVDAAQREDASRELFLRLREESHQLGIGYVNIPWGVGPRVVTWEPHPLALFPSALETITLK